MPRLKAARKLGITEIPVILCDEWTPAQSKASGSSSQSAQVTERFTISRKALTNVGDGCKPSRIQISPVGRLTVVTRLSPSGEMLSRTAPNAGVLNPYSFGTSTIA
jgi:hypothetical protein